MFCTAKFHTAGLQKLAKEWAVWLGKPGLLVGFFLQVEETVATVLCGVQYNNAVGVEGGSVQRVSSETTQGSTRSRAP